MEEMSLSGIYDVKVLLDEEGDVSPTLAFFFKGCDLWCRFCMDYQYAWTRAKDWPVSGQGFKRLLSHAFEHTTDAESESARGLKTISLIGGEPSLRLHDVGEALLSLRSSESLSRPGLLPIVLNSNMLFTRGVGPEAWKGIATYFLADLKFGNDKCAEELTLPGAPARNGKRLTYVGRVKENILRAREAGKVIVRHLLLPGHLHCCTEPILKWMRNSVPDIPIHLLQGYYPNGCSGLPMLEGKVSIHEEDEAMKMAHDYGVNLYSSSSFPDCYTAAPQTDANEVTGYSLVSSLADFESRVRLLCQNSGCALRPETIRIGSDGSLVIPDLSAGIAKLLYSHFK